MHRFRSVLLALLVAGAGCLLTTSVAAAAGPPQIVAAWSSEIASTSVSLGTEVNPEGSATSYRFEYLTEARFEQNGEAFVGATKVPAGAEPGLGSGSSPRLATQPVTGLSPETTYRYRVVAHSVAGTETGPALAFTTEASGGGTTLADGRGYELVSPAEKNGGQIQGPGQISGGDVVQAAANGEAVTYSSSASFGAGAQGAPAASQYLSRRSAAGWSTQNITLPSVSGAYGDEPDGVPYQLFSGDLSRAVMLNGRRCAAGEECPRSYSLLEPPGSLRASTPELLGLRFAGAAPDLSHLAFAAQAGLYEWSGGALEAISEVAGASLAAPAGAISEDGSRVYFVQPENGFLYLHETGHPTRLISEGGVFQAASADGGVTFFTRSGHLYRYLLATETATDLTPSGEVTGVLGASVDGSRVYYATAHGLFLWQAPGATVEVAVGAGAAAPSDWPPATGTARVSADGSRLAFLSAASLTGYDNTDQATHLPDSEVFLYTAGGSLACVSCNPTGERPLGPSTIPGAIANGTEPGSTDSYKPRDLTPGGSRLFFNSADSLVLQDTDNRQDAYEWEAQGAGTCVRAGGCLSLISSGRSPEGATFLDASETGSDVFFITDASLVGSDPGSTDLYDAREGGGFPEASAPIACDGDACQSLPPEPEDPTPGTLSPGSGQPPLHFVKSQPEPGHQGGHKHHHAHRHHHRKRGGR